jgi:hypothetical protein
VAVKNEEKDFFVPLRLCARNGFNGSAQVCPDCPKCDFWRIIPQMRDRNRDRNKVVTEHNPPEGKPVAEYVYVQRYSKVSECL